MKLVAGNHHHRHRRVTEIFRQLELEPVVVDENRVQILVEQLLGNPTLELVVSQI